MSSILEKTRDVYNKYEGDIHAAGKALLNFAPGYEGSNRLTQGVTGQTFGGETLSPAQRALAVADGIAANVIDYMTAGTGSVFIKAGVGAAAFAGRFAMHEGKGLLRAAASGIESIGKNKVLFKGMEVRAVRDLSHVDTSTLKAMSEKGFAPRTINKDKISLHHHNQNPSGFIVEVPFTNHNIWNNRQHPFGNKPGVGLSDSERNAFGAWRSDYWKARAQDELTKRMN